MANSFSSSIGAHRASAMQGAMEVMSGGSFSSVPDPQNGIANRQRAIAKASAWADRGISAASGMGDFMAQMQGQAGSTGLNMVASNEKYKAEKAAAEAALDAQKTSGILGIVTSVAGLALCERRLKTNIHSLDEQRAWTVVRDLPLYSFSYKHAPGPTVYGPMVDEVLPLDSSLVRPTLLPPDEEGEVRGFDVTRHQAYESVALKQALHRIEDLEQEIGKLHDAVGLLLLRSMPTIAEAA